MDIVEFISMFSDLVSYGFSLSICGIMKDKTVVDTDFISENNFEGEMIFSKKAQGKLAPLPEVSLPIHYMIEVDDDFDEYFVVYEKTSVYGIASFNLVDMTSKDGTD